MQTVAQAQRSRVPILSVSPIRSPAGSAPLVITVAALAFVAWAIGTVAARLAYGLVAAVSARIIACPCALVATPMSMMVGVGRGAQAGILIKNAEALERLEKVDTLVVDKTGTLTVGKPTVAALSQHPGSARKRCLSSRQASSASAVFLLRQRLGARRG